MSNYIRITYNHNVLRTLYVPYSSTTWRGFLCGKSVCNNKNRKLLLDSWACVREVPSQIESTYLHFVKTYRKSNSVPLLATLSPRSVYWYFCKVQQSIEDIWDFYKHFNVHKVTMRCDVRIPAEWGWTKTATTTTKNEFKKISKRM